MTSPIEQAKACTPFWMMEIRKFDGLEIHPVRDTRWNDAERGPRPFSAADDNESGCEPCDPDQAHFWSVYGHFKEGGILCFEDFGTEAEAEAFAEQVYKSYPHLQKEPPPSVEGTLLFYAQPYDISATGFYFSSEADYAAKVCRVRNDCGLPVEEFEIQFIDGDMIDAKLAEAFGLNQANVFRFIELADEWDQDQKRRFIIAVGECGYSFDPDTVDPDDFDVDIYEVDSLRELAEQWGIQRQHEVVNHAGIFRDSAAAVDVSTGRSRAEIRIARSPSGLCAMDTCFWTPTYGASAAPSVWNPVAYLSDDDARRSGLEALISRFRSFAALGASDASDARKMVALLEAEKMPQLSLF